MDARLRLGLGVAVLAAVAACHDTKPDATPAAPATTAVIKVASSPSGGGVTVMMDGSPVLIHDGADIAPGRHSFSVTCYVVYTRPALVMDVKETLTGHGSFNLDAQAGHEYTFDTDTPELRSDGCQPYLAETTGDRDLYSETLLFKPDESTYGKWHDFASLEYDAHQEKDRLPADEYRAQLRHIGTLAPAVAHARGGWAHMLETETWEKLSYPDSAEARFQGLSAAVKAACPGSQVTALSESVDDVTYDLEIGADCAAGNGRSQLGRFMTGRYEILGIALIARVPLSQAEKDTWFSVFKAATVKEDN